MKRRKRNETMGETGYSVMSDSRNGDAYRMQRGTAGKGRRYDDDGGNGGYGSASHRERVG